MMHKDFGFSDLLPSPQNLAAEQKQEMDRLYQESDARREEARQRAEDAENALPWNQQKSWRKRGMYGGWMLEPIIEQVTERAAVTLSHYGYKCLNTPDVGIADIDFNLDYLTVFQKLEALASLRAWIAEHETQSFRAYRTSAGLRFMRTDAPQPIDKTYNALCRKVGADDIYRELCHEQKAFRARITPKPSRCGIDMPYWNPYDAVGQGWSQSDPDGTIFPRRVKEYEIVAEKYKVCELLETIGSGVIHPDLLSLVNFHDTRCKVFSDLEFEPLTSEEEDGPSAMQVVVFNEAYRPQGMADEIIWDILPRETRQALRSFETPEARSWVRAEDRRLRQLATKWDKPADSRDAERRSLARSLKASENLTPVEPQE